MLAVSSTITGGFPGPAEIVSKYRYRLGFKYGKADIYFDFRQNTVRQMEIAFDSKRYMRSTIGNGSNYHIYFTGSGGLNFHARDPFEVYIKDFINGKYSNFEEDRLNMELMGEILL